MTRTDSTLISLRTHIKRVLEPLVPSGGSCALIDFPNYSNVGDSAIWLGEIAYLKSKGCKVKHIADWEHYSEVALRAAVGDDVILLSGGGNFGDLYYRHQRLREKIVSAFRDNRIVQLPQSIHFNSEEHLTKTRACLSLHRDFHLVVREKKSLEFAQQYFDCPNHLCPDMALMLDVEGAKPRGSTTDIVVLSRTDNEKASPLSIEGIKMSRGLSIVVSDWLEEPEPQREWLYEWSQQRLKDGPQTPSQVILNKLMLLAANAMARQRLARGLEMLSQGKVVVTDRLHAIILSWSAHIPVFYVDNNYGKLSNFVETWLAECPTITRCKSFQEGMAQASVLH